MPRMAYAIAHLRESHQVHARRIDGEVAVRGRIHQVFLEFVGGHSSVVLSRQTSLVH